MKIAFLTSIYPAHAKKIYRENPSLKYKSSDEQMEFIRWHGLSCYVRWPELLESKGLIIDKFNDNLPEVALAWARENKFKPKSKDSIYEIGLEKIKRFKPDIVFSFAPLAYIKSNFLNELIGSLSKKPKIIAWYGANCGNEEIFSFFDLTLSNSKHLVNSLKEKGINAKFLKHAFDPVILDKIKIPSKRLNRLAFFGNLDLNTNDFSERTRLLEQISDQTGILDVYGAYKKPSFRETTKYNLLEVRQKISSSIGRFVYNKKLNFLSDKQNLPPSPWLLSRKFCSRIKPPLYGREMLQRLSNYQMALNYHNKHTGDFACNMRLFEAAGVGCCLITDYKSDLDEYFENGKEILSYKTKDELIEILSSISNDKCQIMGQNAQIKVLNIHNTELQIKRLIELVIN